MSETMIQKLSLKMSEEAVQRTKKADTKKGYDTDGYGYQYCVDRFNEVCDDKWGFDWNIVKEREGTYSGGSHFFELVVNISIWVGDKALTRSCVGGHVSMSYADALKGAITNGFKKTASFWGVGRDAYAGTIDDDNKPMPDSLDNVKSIPKTAEKAGNEKQGYAYKNDKKKTPVEWAEHWAQKIQDSGIECDWELINSLPIEKRSFKLKEIFDKGKTNKKEDSPF